MGKFTVYCQGLAFETTREDVLEFFGNDGIALMEMPRNDRGQAKGWAIIDFENEDYYNAALKKDKQNLGRRYVDVRPHDAKAMEKRREPGSGGGGGSRHHGRDSHGSRESYGRGARGRDSDYGFRHGECAVRLAGLPYDANQRDIEHFFSPLPIVQNGIVLPKDLVEARGEAIVVFTDREAGYAALERTKQYIGKRFIDVFQASYNEVEEFCRRNKKRIPYATAEDSRGGRGGSMSGGGGYPPVRTPGPGYMPPRPLMGVDPYAYSPTPPTRGPAPVPYGAGAPSSYSDPYAYGGPTPLFPGRNSDEYYGDQALPLPSMKSGSGESWRDGQGGGGSGGRGSGYGWSSDSASPWDAAGGDPYADYYLQSNGGGPMKGGGGSRPGRQATAAPWERDGGRHGSGGGQDYGRGGGQRTGPRYRLKMRGVPFKATTVDIENFFAPIRPVRIDFEYDRDGRPNGEVRVEFANLRDYDSGIEKDRQYMGSRYVELFPDLR